MWKNPSGSKVDPETAARLDWFVALRVGDEVGVYVAEYCSKEPCYRLATVITPGSESTGMRIRVRVHETGPGWIPTSSEVSLRWTEVHPSGWTGMTGG